MSPYAAIQKAVADETRATLVLHVIQWRGLIFASQTSPTSNLDREPVACEVKFDIDDQP